MSKIVCIDPGNNPIGIAVDPGVQVNDINAADISLAIAQKLKPLLEANDITVITTRDAGAVPGDYTTVSGSLQARCDISNNAGADAFISIHVNTGGGSGVGIYINKSGSDAETLASVVLQHLVSSADWDNKGITVVNEYELANTSAPAAILTQCGYIDNAADAAKLKDDGVLEALAEAHAKGICEFFGIEYKEASTDPEPIVQTDSANKSTADDGEEAATSDPKQGSTSAASSTGTVIDNEALIKTAVEQVITALSPLIANISPTAATTSTDSTVTVDGLLTNLAGKMSRATFWVGMFSILKLVTDSCGLKLPDIQWDNLANALAVIGGVVGVVSSHIKNNG